MNRLLQGDVGSGKTIVATLAALQAIESGYQVAIMAPTEILAEQHYKKMLYWLAPLNIQVAWLSGSQSKKERTASLEAIASGSAQLAIGTHALFQTQVEFKKLGFVVVDEQHRFGVEQRDALRMKAKQPPHLLVMTATPIPRTVAMTVFGDLDISTLRELPGGRTPIQTHLIPTLEKPHYLDRAWQRVREEVEKGHQVYIVAPRISNPDKKLTDREIIAAQLLGEEF